MALLVGDLALALWALITSNEEQLSSMLLAAMCHHSTLICICLILLVGLIVTEQDQAHLSAVSRRIHVQQSPKQRRQSFSATVQQYIQVYTIPVGYRRQLPCPEDLGRYPSVRGQFLYPLAEAHKSSSNHAQISEPIA